ncbi:MAG: hypothetical protein ACI828_001837 [Flavobacteriales bacterium]|jgi:hypothetical protein
MKKILLGLVALFCALSIHAQETESETTTAVEWNDNSFLSFDISTPLLGKAARYNIGYVHHLKNRWKVGMHVGYGNESINFLETNENMTLFEVRPAVYYFTNPERKSPIYYGVELYYVNQQDTRVNGDYNAEGPEGSFAYDRADFKREKYGLNLTFGVVMNLTEKLKLNFFYGMGPRVRQISYTNAVNLRPTDGGDNFIYRSGSEREGYSLGLDANLGLKLFYKL